MSFDDTQMTRLNIQCGRSMTSITSAVSISTPPQWANIPKQIMAYGSRGSNLQACSFYSWCLFINILNLLFTRVCVWACVEMLADNSYLKSEVEFVPFNIFFSTVVPLYSNLAWCSAVHRTRLFAFTAINTMIPRHCSWQLVVIPR